MSKRYVVVIAAIAVAIGLIVKGGDRVASIVIYVVTYAGAGLVFLFVAAIPYTVVCAILNRRKLDAARREYQDIQTKHGYSAREHCPHRVIEVVDTDYIVFTASNKWCKICGKDLGPAKLKKSFLWGNRWE